MPVSIRLFGRKILYCPYSFGESLTPPSRLSSFYGKGNAVALGNHMVNSFISIAGLKPDEKVLDVGCGIGRVALPLTGYLGNKGQYYGFDIVPEGIKWCKKNIEPKFPHFHFQQADIYNRFYNPKGKYKASEYRFPFNDNTFDFIYLTSVFTHMLTKDLQHYMSEVSRVLKDDNGRCFITYFLINLDTLQLMNEGRSHGNFRYMLDEHCYSLTDSDPERAVAYDETFIRGIYKENNLDIIEPLHYGSWRVNQPTLDFQDVIVASRSGQK